MPTVMEPYTPTQLEEWKKIRRNRSASLLENPRTGRTIKRNSATFQSLERALESLEKNRDNEGALVKVMEHLALTGDTRSATKIGVLTRSLQKEYKVRVPSKGRQNYALYVPIDIIQEVVQEVLVWYEAEFLREDTHFTVSKKVPVEVSYCLRQILLNRLEFVKRISCTPILVKREDITTILKAFVRSYRDCSIEMMYVSNITGKVAEAFERSGTVPFTPSQRRLYDFLYTHYGASKNIATFFALFLFVYTKEYITGMFHKVRREESKGTLRVSLSNIYHTCQLRHTLMKEGIDYLIQRNRLEHFENLLPHPTAHPAAHNVFISPNVVLYYDKREVPLITFLREKNRPDFVAVVEGHPSFLEPLPVVFPE